VNDLLLEPQPVLAGLEIPVVLADAHEMMHRSLLRVLQLAPGIRVVGEAFDLAGTLEQIRRRRPRVVVLDMRLPGGSPLANLRAHAGAGSTRIVATTMTSTPSLAREALRVGAHAVVLKDDADSELPLAIAAAARGATFVSCRLRTG
jgi:DNA-binding NarL/FixJ family response regulator